MRHNVMGKGHQRESGEIQMQCRVELMVVYMSVFLSRDRCAAAMHGVNWGGCGDSVLSLQSLCSTVLADPTIVPWTLGRALR